MSAGRVAGHGLERGRRVEILIDGEPAEAYEGESVAAAVMADCVMVVDGVPQTRTCVTWVREGMTVEHQFGSGTAADAEAAHPH